jgi:hypothetical protein
MALMCGRQLLFYSSLVTLHSGCQFVEDMLEIKGQETKYFESSQTKNVDTCRERLQAGLPNSNSYIRF